MTRGHKHKPSYWLTPTVTIDGRPQQPVSFRRCLCGHTMEPQVLGDGRRLIEQGWSLDELTEMSAKQHSDDLAADARARERATKPEATIRLRGRS